MSAATPFRWTEYVQLRARYHRSVHLARDAGQVSALEGYLLTPLVCGATERIVRGLQDGNIARAWSVTGPYGSGKSAFALFLADLLAAPPGPATAKARKLLRERDATLSEALFGKGGVLSRHPGLCPIVASGERRGLDHTLLEALYAGAQHFWSGPGKKPTLLEEIKSAVKRVASGKRMDSRQVVALFEQTAKRIAASGNAGRGLFVVLDEGGKALEYAAQNPEASDIMLLQELAEAASRSGETPIVFAVVLHQAFESYTSKLSAAQRNEWMKVQGRFEDIPFQESLDEILVLMGDALARKDLPPELEAAAEKEAAETAQSLPMPASSRDKLRDALVRTYPLNPITALALPQLFKSRLAQNERSLFAFLSSSEPHAFQDFLELAEEGAHSYGLDRLYDYVVSTVGSRLFGAFGRYWLQVDAALRRLPDDAEPLDVQVLKAIGVLGALGESSGLVASENVLALAFRGLLLHTARSKLKASLERLSAASLIVFRKFKGAYQIWEGSDVDLDKLTHRALDQLGTTATVADRLGRLFPPRPVVARRHLFETGTMRFFEVRYADESLASKGVRNATTEGDGIVWIVIASSPHAASEFTQKLAQPACWSGNLPAVVGVVRGPERLTQLAREAAALERVRAETPQLEADPVARRELSLRFAEVEQLLRYEVAQLTQSEEACAWFDNGRAVSMFGARGLTALVSSVCDEAFDLAPIIHNELLNRAELSSAAAAARRNLMEAMIERSDQVALGFTGAPPELAMYGSLLQKHRLHRKRAGAWSFTAPDAAEKGSLRPAYEAIGAALERHADGRLSVVKLYEELRAPPYGLRDGVIPILLLAVVLERQPEIAVYEGGAFQPSFSGPLVERLLRRPDQFEVQLYRIAGARRSALHALGTVGENEALGPVELVRRWVKAVRSLSEFARATRFISERAQAVRDILMRGKEPGPLLFRDLPAACGLEPIEARPGGAAGPVKDFAQRIQGVLRELEGAYPRLLDRIEETILTTFGVEARSPVAGRLELAARATVLVPNAGDAQLRGVLMRLAEGELARDQWLVSVGALICGRPPDAWADRDLDLLKSSLTLVARRFASLEALVLDAGGGIAPIGVSLLRVSVSEPRVPERERVVAVRGGDAEMVTRLCRRLREVVEAASGDLSRDAVVAGLAMVTRDLLAELDAEAQPHPHAESRN